MLRILCKSSSVTRTEVANWQSKVDEAEKALDASRKYVHYVENIVLEQCRQQLSNYTEATNERE